MPRLSLYKPTKSNDFKFFDRAIYEQFQIGGVDVHVHKYIGPVDPGDPSKALGETTIQDVVFLENRDRKYSENIFTIRGHFQTQDIDFNLSQFGLFLQNDTIFMTVHINNTVDLIGRKIMSGDVFELPNLKDEYALNEHTSSLKRFYVVEDINRAASGFSATWYPHLYRIKLKPMMDSQEFKDILERPADDDSYAGVFSTGTTYYAGQVVRYKGTLYEAKGNGPLDIIGTTVSPPDPSAWTVYLAPSLKDVLSTYSKELAISNAVNIEAEMDAPKSGYEISHFYTLAVDPKTGITSINTADTGDNVASDLFVDIFENIPLRDGYTGYLVSDGIAPNQPLDQVGQFGHGIQFPKFADNGDFFLRTDFLPNRLFRHDAGRWIKQEDNVRMTLSNTDDRQTLKTSFVNNNETTGLGRIAADIVNVDATGAAKFEPGNATVSFTVNEINAFIVTNVAYNASYKVEVWLDEEAKATDIVTSDTGGNLSFAINHSIHPSSRIRYTIYSRSVDQRQFPSKALRKLKPQADN